jgi:uncharacterized protein (DUF433 family)
MSTRAPRRRRRTDVPLYSIAEAARYAWTKPPTLRRWALGYQAADGTAYPPLLVLPEERPAGEPALSWENLVEAALLTHWRSKRISLQRLRRAHDLAVEEFGPHPFARREVYTDGLDLFIAADEPEEGDDPSALLTVVTRDNQRVLAPAVESYLTTFDWQNRAEAPYQWRPLAGFSEGDAVRLNPDIDFGQPGVKRIRTETIFGRWMAHEAFAEIADDFQLEPAEVEQAIRYEVVLRRPSLALAA